MTERLAKLATDIAELPQEAVPTGAVSPGKKRGLILGKLRQKRLERGAVEIPRLPRDGRDFALSTSQQRLWFIEQVHPDAGIYNIGLTVRLAGKLRLAALRAALQGVIDRHESLRTAFGSKDGEPFQRIVRGLNLSVPLVDLSRSGRDEKAVAPMVSRFRREPFDLKWAPLLRVVVLRVDPGLHVMVLSQHHIVTDGWSMSVLIQEVLTLYRSIVENAHPDLPEVPVQFVDYAAWRRDVLDAEVLTRLLDFWKKHLEGSPAVLEMPGDRPRPAMQSYRGELLPLHIPAALTGKLRERAREEGTTLFVMALAAFQCVLYLWSQQKDIVIGMPIANRPSSELRQMMGFLTNTLALRSTFGPRTRLVDHVALVHKLILEAHRHQEVPFDRLVEALRPERTLSHTPLFQVAFAFQNMPMPRLELPDLTLDPLPIGSGTSLFDMVLNLEEGAEQLRGWIEYNTDVFDPTTILRFASSLHCLLAALVDDLEAEVEAVPRMSPAEHHQLVREWNDTSHFTRNGTESETLIRLVEKQVCRSPAAEAVIFGGMCLSYAELDRRANQLAHALRQLSVGPECYVGIALVRSLEMVVALLGVLKAGGAYVPLEPSYPQERLAYMMADSGLSVLLTTSGLSPSLPVPEGVPVLELDRLAFPEVEPEGAPPVPVEGCHAAYLIYTSGSTGRPKAVIVPHAGVCNRLLRIQERYPLWPGDRVLQKTPFSFDVSVWEFFWPLVSGATLVVAPPDAHQDPVTLARVIERYGITILHFVPSMLAVFLEQPELEGCAATLRRVFVSGEALTEALSERFFRRFALPLENLYGPTEASIEVTLWSGRPAMPGRSRPPVSIGRPIGNLRIHLLDSVGYPVAIGVAGELQIGGAGVVRGYSRRPSLTAERFTPDPFPRPGRGGERLYRSGDRARYRADGEIEFLGRLDHQVKVRGFRIELGEIEGRLREHPQVREAVVTAWGEEPGDQRLVAYAVARDDVEPPDLETLRPFLLVSLPEYMVPSNLVLLDGLPLTSSGKLDRRALPAPHFEDRRNHFVAPRNPIEEVLCELWGRLLDLPRVSVHDNFFAVGGHSLLAPRLISRIGATFGIELTMGWLFERPTVAGLAEVVQRCLDPGVLAPDRLEPLTAVDRPQRIPLSFPQLRFWIRRPAEGDSGMSNIFSGTWIRGPLDSSALYRGLQWVVDRHEILRTGFYQVDGEVFQQIRPPAAPIALPRVDLSVLSAADSEGERTRIAQVLAALPFDLGQDALIRFILVRLALTGDSASPEHALLMAQDHLTADGWSGSVFAHELADGYGAFCKGRVPPTLPLGVQYADYAIWQQRQFEIRGQALRAYWLERLDYGNFPVISLPVNFPASSCRKPAGSVRKLLLDAPTSKALIELGRGEHASLFMTVLATFKTFLRQWAGQSDLVVTTNIAHRDRVEIESLIGVFTNLLVFRTDLAGNLSFREILGRVRHSTLESYRHQDFPFSDLLQILAPDRPDGLNELFPVGCVLEEMPLPPLQLSGLEIEPIRVHRQVLSRDLLLRATPRQERLQLDLNFRTDLFREGTMDAAMELFESLLRAIVAEPDRPLSELRYGAAPSGESSSSGLRRRVLAAPRSPVSSAMEESVGETLAAVADLALPVPRSSHIGNAGSFNYGWLALTDNTRLCIIDHTLYGVDEIYLPWALLGDRGRIRACFDPRGRSISEHIGRHASCLYQSVPVKHRSLLNFALCAEIEGRDLMAEHLRVSTMLARQINGSKAMPWSGELCRMEPILRPVIVSFFRRRQLHLLFQRWVMTSSKGFASLQKLDHIEYPGGSDVIFYTGSRKLRFRGSIDAMLDNLFHGLQQVRGRLLEGRQLGEVAYPWFTNIVTLVVHALEAYQASPQQRVFWHATGSTNHLYVRQADFLHQAVLLVEALVEAGYLPAGFDLRLIPTYGSQLFAVHLEALPLLEGLLVRWREELRRQGRRSEEWLTALAGTTTPAKVVSAFANELSPEWVHEFRQCLERFNAADLNHLPHAYLPNLHHPTYNKFGVSQHTLVGRTLHPPAQLHEMRWVEAELLVRFLAHLTLDRKC